MVREGGAVTSASACSSCGADAPGGARFCPSCGAALAQKPGVTTERKVVTVLFCDLVGFTALCEHADPEDIDRLLRDYYTFVRDLIERYGGSSESIYPFKGPEAGRVIAKEGLEQASRRGMDLTSRWFRSSIVQFQRPGGCWRDALQSVAELESVLGSEDPTDLIDLQTQVAVIRLHQGDLESASRLTEWCIAQAPSDIYTQIIDLEMRSAIACRQGDNRAAQRLLVRLEHLTRGRRRMSAVNTMLPLVMRTALSAGTTDVAALILPDEVDQRPLERCASLTLAGREDEQAHRIDAAEQNFASAASACASFGDPFEEACSQVDRARCLVALGRAQKAVAPLAEAREAFSRLGAGPALAEVYELMSRVRTCPA